MRIAAGILMFIGALLGITMLRAAYGYIPGLLGWLPWFWAVFIGAGGFDTLKRRNWGLCLISSMLLLLPCLILPFFVWADALRSGEEINVPFALAITLFFLMIGILPIIFVILRKGDWRSGYRKNQ